MGLEPPPSWEVQTGAFVLEGEWCPVRDIRPQYLDKEWRCKNNSRLFLKVRGEFKSSRQHGKANSMIKDAWFDRLPMSTTRTASMNEDSRPSTQTGGPPCVCWWGDCNPAIPVQFPQLMRAVHTARSDEEMMSLTALLHPPALATEIAVPCV